MTDLRCPKDQTAMRSIERNGVTVERCPECGGIFLDRGELERLIEAEGMYADRDAQAAGARDADDRAYGSRGGNHGGDEGGHHGGRPDYPPKRKRRGFLGDLLDFG